MSVVLYADAHIPRPVTVSYIEVTFFSSHAHNELSFWTALQFFERPFKSSRLARYMAYENRVNGLNLVLGEQAVNDSSYCGIKARWIGVG
jgi:hypothetical protein